MDVLTLAVAGIFVGALYGLLAVSVTVMYRTTGTLSFAHGGFALLSAYSYSNLACGRMEQGQCTGVDTPLPPLLAAAVSVLLAVVVALVVERVVMRPLADAPPVNRLIASVAVLALCSGVALQLNGSINKAVPERSNFLPTGNFELFGVVVDAQRVAIFLIAIALAAVLVYILRNTWLGLALRACGQAPDSARLMGVRPTQIAQFNWAVAGLVSGLAGVLVAPVSVVTSGTFAFLIIKAIGACVIGGLFSLPVSLAAGLLVGLLESVVPNYTTRPGAPQLVIALVVIAAVVVNRYRSGGIAPPRASTVTAIKRVGRTEQEISLYLDGFRRLLSPIPAAIKAIPVVVIVAYCLTDTVRAGHGADILFYALIVLSLRIMTGLSSQPSLMQYGYAGLGAFTMLTCLNKDLPFLVSVAIGMAVGAALGVLTGAVSVYFRRLEFAILTLVFGSVISDYVLVSEKWTNTISDPTVFGKSLLEAENVLGTFLILSLVVFLLVGRLTTSTIGTALRASAEMEARVGHFSVDTRRWELAAFGLAGAIAALAGCLLAFQSGAVNAFQFAPVQSLTLLLVAVVAGMGNMWGCLWGGLLFGYGPVLISDITSSEAGNYPAILSSALALVILVKAPGGLAGLFQLAQRNLTTASSRSSGDTFRGHDVQLTRFRPAPLPSEIDDNARTVSVDLGSEDVEPEPTRPKALTAVTRRRKRVVIDVLKT